MTHTIHVILKITHLYINSCVTVHYDNERNEEAKYKKTHRVGYVTWIFACPLYRTRCMDAFQLVWTPTEEWTYWPK